jgi:hypothetical protein
MVDLVKVGIHAQTSRALSLSLVEGSLHDYYLVKIVIRSTRTKGTLAKGSYFIFSWSRSF